MHALGVNLPNAMEVTFLILAAKVQLVCSKSSFSDSYFLDDPQPTSRIMQTKWLPYAATWLHVWLHNGCTMQPIAV